MTATNSAKFKIGCSSFFRNPVGVRPVVRGRGRTAAGSRSAGGRAYLLNGFLPSLTPVVPGYVNGPNYHIRRRQVSVSKSAPVSRTGSNFFLLRFDFISKAIEVPLVNQVSLKGHPP